MEFIFSHTNLTHLIPCHGHGDGHGINTCIATTVEHANSVVSAEWLETKVACLKNMRVSTEWLHGVMEASHGSHALSVEKHPNGTATILDSVCTCDITWGLAGENCTETAAGTAIRFYFIFIMVGILFLVVRLATKLARGGFKTRRKRGLASIALAQYCGQLMWLAGCKPFRGLFATEYWRLGFLLFGHVIVTVTVFMLVCGMLLETSAMIRQDAKQQEAQTVKALLALDKVFQVMPVVVALGTMVLCVTFTPLAMMMMALLQTLALVAVAGAFAVTTNALDKRIKRLMPREGQAHTQDETQGLLEVSKKLRNVSSWMRNVSLLVVLTSNVYVFVFMEFDAVSHGIVCTAHNFTE
jgi:hypothetical protein